MDNFEGPGLTSRAYQTVGFLYGLVGFFLSLLSVIITSTISLVWPQPYLPRNGYEELEAPLALARPATPEHRVHKSHPRPISSSHYRDFHLPPLTPVDEELVSSDDKNPITDGSTQAAFSERRSSADSDLYPPPSDPVFSSQPESMDISASPVDATALDAQDLATPQTPSCSSSSRLKLFVSRQSSLRSTHSSHSSDDQLNNREKKKGKRDLRRLCPTKAFRHSIASYEHDSSPSVCLRRIKTETSLSDSKRSKREEKHKQPPPRTQPYEYPYFFPSPTSPEAQLYTQTLNMERKLRAKGTPH